MGVWLGTRGWLWRMGLVGLICVWAQGGWGEDCFLSTEPAVFDLGDLEPGQQAQGIFTLTNTTEQTVVLDPLLRTSCGCTQATVETTQLEPGQSTSVPFHYQADRRPGPDEQTVWLQVIAPADQTVALGLKACVRTVVRVTPERLMIEPWGETSATMTLTLESADSIPFSVVAADYEPLASHGQVGRDLLSVELNPREEDCLHRLSVVFDRRVLGPQLPGFLNVRLTHPRLQALRIPCVVDYGIEVEPDLVIFEDQEPGEEKTCQLKISPTGQRPLPPLTVASVYGKVKILNVEVQPEGAVITLSMPLDLETCGLPVQDVVNIEVKDEEKGRVTVVPIECTGQLAARFRNIMPPLGQGGLGR